jgi:hypothetical protein
MKLVDFRRLVTVADADLRSDEEAALIETGPQHADLWSINLYSYPE